MSSQSRKTSLNSKSEVPLLSSNLFWQLHWWHRLLYTHIHADVSRNIMTTSMNERTHFFIKIYLSHFIRKGWCWLCVRGELETKTDCHILTPSSSDHSSTSFTFWLGCSTVGHWEPKLVLTPRACYLQLRLELTASNWLPWAPTDPSHLWHLVI